MRAPFKPVDAVRRAKRLPTVCSSFRQAAGWPWDAFCSAPYWETLSLPEPTPPASPTDVRVDASDCALGDFDEAPQAPDDDVDERGRFDAAVREHVGESLGLLRNVLPAECGSLTLDGYACTLGMLRRNSVLVSSANQGMALCAHHSCINHGDSANAESIAAALVCHANAEVTDPPSAATGPVAWLCGGISGTVCVRTVHTRRSCATRSAGEVRM